MAPAPRRSGCSGRVDSTARVVNHSVHTLSAVQGATQLAHCAARLSSHEPDASGANMGGPCNRHTVQRVRSVTRCCVSCTRGTSHQLHGANSKRSERAAEQQNPAQTLAVSSHERTSLARRDTKRSCAAAGAAYPATRVCGDRVLSSAQRRAINRRLSATQQRARQRHRLFGARRHAQHAVAE